MPRAYEHALRDALGEIGTISMAVGRLPDAIQFMADQQRQIISSTATHSIARLMREFP